MVINQRERNILLMAAAVGVVFLITTLLPTVRDVYQQRSERIEDIRLEIERERRLVDDAAEWRSRRVEVENQLAEMETRIFTGATVPVIEANIQRALTQHARDTGISVTSTRLAERLESETWLLIQQEMSFRTDNAANTIAFLQKLDESLPRLWVTDFSLDQARNMYNGSITVVGFARREGVQLATGR
ncbi:MAG: hypothetical protein RLZZ385_715 [Pseudomonadota bacterium]|jgi:hypothetical protein